MLAKSSLQLRLERLQADHIPEILEIERESNTAAWSEQSFRNELTNPESLFFVAFARGRLVGYGGAWKVIDELHITNVAVHPEARRQGIGTRILERLLEEGIEAGMVCATLEVRASNEAAIQLYERLGFERTAVRRRYYPDNREDAVVMWRYELGDPPR